MTRRYFTFKFPSLLLCSSAPILARMFCIEPVSVNTPKYGYIPHTFIIYWTITQLYTQPYIKRYIPHTFIIYWTITQLYTHPYIKRYISHIQNILNHHTTLHTTIYIKRYISNIHNILNHHITLHTTIYKEIYTSHIHNNHTTINTTQRYTSHNQNILGHCVVSSFY